MTLHLLKLLAVHPDIMNLRKPRPGLWKQQHKKKDEGVIQYINNEMDLRDSNKQ